MSNQFPALVRLHPSFSEPGLIITQAQASGAFELLAGGAPEVKIGSEDLVVYVKSLDLRTQALASQSSSNFLPSASLVGQQWQTPTYLLKARANWDHHDVAAAAMWDVSLPEAQRYALNQGIYQQLRNMLLYGLNPANGEGLLNAPNAIQVNLPPDPFGNDTFVNYDNGAMALFWLSQFVTIKSGMFQSGGAIKSKIRIVGPQRIFLALAQANVVQLTSYQRPGAGTATVGQEIREVTTSNGDDVEWFFDDTLEGKGQGGTDAVILTIPEIEVPVIPGINTNKFGQLKPGLRNTSAMYMDMAAPREIPTPIPDGGITVIQELRSTCGWNLRPQGLMIVSIPYE